MTIEELNAMNVGKVIGSPAYTTDRTGEPIPVEIVGIVTGGFLRVRSSTRRMWTVAINKVAVSINELEK